MAAWRFALLLVAATASVVASAAGCYTHQCDANTVPYSGGEMIDEDHYETSPLDSPKTPWVDFPGNVTLAVTYPESARNVIAGRPVVGIEAAVGLSNRPNVDGSQWTPAAGQLAELTNAGPLGFSATNGSCAGYFARFVVQFAPRDAGPEAGDAAGE